MTRIVATGLALLVLLLAGGCPKSGTPEFGEEEITWPPPPEPPRIRWTGHIASSRWAAPPSRFQRFLSGLGGRDEAFTLKKPYAVTRDVSGRVLVSDTGWGRVMVFDRANRSFSWLGHTGQGTLQRPLGVATDSRGHIFVADAALHRIFEYGADLEFVRSYGADVLNRPVGVAVHEVRKELWTADARTHSVEVFNLDGTHARSIGGRGTDDGRFNYPTNLAVGPDGNVYVADTLNFRIQVLDPEGGFVRKWGRNCDGFGCMGRLKGIAVDRAGRVFTVDAAFNVVQIFDAEGGLLLFFGGVGNGPGKLWLPSGIHVGADGEVLVVSQYNWRVNQYQLVDGTAPSVEVP